MNQPLHTGELKRGLQNRHIQLIALGGASGAGLFLGSAGVIKPAAPSIMNAALVSMLLDLGVERDNILLDDFAG